MYNTYLQVLDKLLTKFKQEGSKVIVFSDSVRVSISIIFSVVLDESFPSILLLQLLKVSK